VKNVLLLSIPDREYKLIRPHLEYVDLEHQKMLHGQGDQIDTAYFPNDGMVSLVVGTTDGRSVEVGIVGKEGMVGTPLAVGLRRAPYDAVVQIPGCAIAIESKHLTSQLAHTPRLWLALTRFVLMQGLQMAQVAACNRLHELEQRLARWLLMAQDRVDSEMLYLTHDFLAQMLGTGRPSVSLAIGMLEHAGFIENLRGTIRVLNRKALEGSACECYHVIQHFNGGLGLK
jgi:CRP-like cAMP-binding protein